MATEKIRQLITSFPTQFVSNLRIKMLGEFYSGSGTYAMASIMSSPISTAFLAWSLHGSGSPDTQ